jgi:hypothetical protein
MGTRTEQRAWPLLCKWVTSSNKHLSLASCAELNDLTYITHFLMYSWCVFFSMWNGWLFEAYNKIPTWWVGCTMSVVLWTICKQSENIAYLSLDGSHVTSAVHGIAFGSRCGRELWMDLDSLLHSVSQGHSLTKRSFSGSWFRNVVNVTGF